MHEASAADVSQPIDIDAAGKKGLSPDTSGVQVPPSGDSQYSRHLEYQADWIPRYHGERLRDAVDPYLRTVE